MIKYVPVILFPQYDFINMITGDTAELVKGMEDTRQQAKVASGYIWDNSNFMFSDICGRMYTFQIHGNLLSVWNYTGNTSLFDGFIPQTTPAEKRAFINNVIHICENFSNGLAQCSSCHKDMDYEENKTHHYFAGIYCADCWEREYKEKEAKETYN